MSWVYCFPEGTSLNSLLLKGLADPDHQMPGQHWVTLACLWFKRHDTMAPLKVAWRQAAAVLGPGESKILWVNLGPAVSVWGWALE